jgi:hypothetical protein
MSSVYGFLAGTWPFGVVEAIWAVIALDRYRKLRLANGLNQLPDVRARVGGG